MFIPDWEKVRIINGEEITAESGWYPIVKYYIEHSDSIRKDSAIDLSCGDINADGKIDLTDLSELSLSIIGDKTLTESQIKAADINENGETDLPDLARLRQYLSKVVNSLR